MKRVFLAAIIALMAVLAMPQLHAAERRVLADVASLPGVESVYVSSAAIRIMGGVASLDDMPGVPDDIMKALKDINAIEVIECTNEESIKKIRERVAALVKQTGVELILETTDARESQRIYSRVPDDGPTATTFKDLLIEDIKSTNSYTVVYIGGTLDMRTLQKLSEQ